MTKDKHDSQREFRHALWFESQDPKEPLVISIPHAVDFMRPKTPEILVPWPIYRSPKPKRVRALIMGRRDGCSGRPFIRAEIVAISGALSVPS